MLQVRVLQALAVDAGGAPVPLPRSRKARSLLGWLAVHPGMHPRSRVAERFWPDISEAAARNSLRQALWELRTVLGEHAAHLVSTREQVGLVPGPGLRVDLWDFRTLLAEGRLDDALELAGGVLLEDIDDEWAYDAREDHRRRLVEVLAVAANAAEAEADGVRAVERSRRLIHLDPYNEEGHRHLMRRLAATGDVAGAIKVFDELGRRLRHDLGLPVSSDTRNLAEEIRSARRRPTGRTPVTAVTPLPVAPPDEPFVGRDDELARLLAILTTASRGRRETVLIEGDAGIGKTRLALELCRAAAGRGCTVLFGRCTEEPLVAYEPFVEALRRQVLTAPAHETQAALPADAAELVTLLPELEGHLALSAARTSTTAEFVPTDRFRLFEAVTALLHGLARRSPVVLALDDLHWADRPSLLLLRHLARSPAEGALLVVATYRGGELEGNVGLQEALADLPRRPLERIHLQGLATSGVAALVSRRTGHTASDELVDVIQRRTAGNPFFIGEVMRNLTESGALTVHQAKRVWDLASPDVALPEAVNDVVSRRISRLGDLGQRVLEAASVAGQEFRLDVVARAMSVSGDQLLDVLDAAVRGRLLSEVAGIPGRYAFHHPLVREVLYTGLTVNRRAYLHGRTAEALEALPPGEASSEELARHFLLAGSPATAEKAVGHALAAAEQAMRQRAYEEAVDLMDQVLDRLPAGDRSRRRHVLRRRAVAHTAAVHAIIEPRRLPTATT